MELTLRDFQAAAAAGDHPSIRRSASRGCFAWSLATYCWLRSSARSRSRLMMMRWWRSSCPSSESRSDSRSECSALEVAPWQLPALIVNSNQFVPKTSEMKILTVKLHKNIFYFFLVGNFLEIRTWVLLQTNDNVESSKRINEKLHNRRRRCW